MFGFGAAGGRVAEFPCPPPLRRAGARSTHHHVGGTLEQYVNLLRNKVCGLDNRLVR